MMENLKELFEIQAGLDAEILKNHPAEDGEDRLEKKHVALLVELGEMFNEFRQWKFWSHDRQPRIKVMCRKCGGSGKIRTSVREKPRECEECQGTGECDYVLKELVDCLHFVLGIGLEHGFDKDDLTHVFAKKFSNVSIEGHFIKLLQVEWNSWDFENGIDLFIGLTELLGYTWEQVTEAYLIKNQENHYRQMNGY